MGILSLSAALLLDAAVLRLVHIALKKKKKAPQKCNPCIMRVSPGVYSLTHVDTMDGQQFKAGVTF